jgi:hypothetical protein
MPFSISEVRAPGGSPFWTGLAIVDRRLASQEKNPSQCALIVAFGCGSAVLLLKLQAFDIALASGRSPTAILGVPGCVELSRNSFAIRPRCLLLVGTRLGSAML